MNRYVIYVAIAILIAIILVAVMHIPIVVIAAWIAAVYFGAEMISKFG